LVWFGSDDIDKKTEPNRTAVYLNDRIGWFFLQKPNQTTPRTPLAERLGLEGASVVISSRKQQNVEEAAEKLRAKGIEVLALVCHVSNDQQRKDLIQKTAQEC
ncbi:tropinone reductase-like 3, partial [Arachis hypogaea]|uniref:tropinone reductase-like 3 n=1 Tax=Arachis hypogaea TaxID=3818 RepID=UPI003B20F31E